MRALQVWTLLILTLSTAWADTYVPVWIDSSAKLAPEAVARVVQQLEQQDPNPEHIVFLVHGFKVPRDSSERAYKLLTERVKTAFAKHQRKVSVVGIQWDSNVEVFVLKLPGAYRRKAHLARSVGRFGARQLMLEIQRRFPEANLSVLAHSMGCEVTAAAFRPELSFEENDHHGAHRPDEVIRLNTLVMAGSDLDYDIMYKGGVVAEKGRLKLIWMTMSQLWTSAERDKILDLRKLIRGRAWGATFPRWTEQQYDLALGAQAAVFDNQNIPRGHSLLLYYDQDRIDSVVQAMAHKADPDSVAPPEVLKEVQKVMAAPADPKAMAAFVDAPDLSPRIYAIWRLEKMLCGGSQHIANEYLTRVSTMAKKRPRRVYREREQSPCETVKQGYWPTSLTLERGGAPEWARHVVSSWIKDFRGEVIAINDTEMTLKTARFEDELVIDISDSRFLPRQQTVRVGSKVQVRCHHDLRAIEVRTIPFHVWLKEMKK